MSFYTRSILDICWVANHNMRSTSDGLFVFCSRELIFLFNVPKALGIKISQLILLLRLQHLLDSAKSVASPLEELFGTFDVVKFGPKYEQSANIHSLRLIYRAGLGTPELERGFVGATSTLGRGRFHFGKGTCCVRGPNGYTMLVFSDKGQEMEIAWDSKPLGRAEYDALLL